MRTYMTVTLLKNINDMNLINIIDNYYFTATNYFKKYNKQQHKHKHLCHFSSTQ